MWHDLVMDSRRLRKLAHDWRRADAALTAARSALGAALLEETEAETPQKDLVAVTDINRETIRLMVNKARRDRTTKQGSETAT